MTTLLIAYSATAYFFSGSVCYLAILNSLSENNGNSQFNKLTKIWVTCLWPVWVMSQIKAEDKSEMKQAVPYSLPERELVSTYSGKNR